MRTLPFRSVDNASYIEHVYHRPDELIGFADLLLHWPSLSFYKVPFFTVMRRVGEDFGFYLHLYEAQSIAFSDVLPDSVPETTRESPFEEDGTQKPRRKNAKPRKKTATELEADRMYVHLKFQTPLNFTNRFEHLYNNFCRLYFLRSEVEAIEKAHPECCITSTLAAKEDSHYYGLYKTTEKNIADVAHQTLIRMASTSFPVQHPPHSGTACCTPTQVDGGIERAGEPMMRVGSTSTMFPVSRFYRYYLKKYLAGYPCNFAGKAQKKP